jgi:hypothetical protein
MLRKMGKLCLCLNVPGNYTSASHSGIFPLRKKTTLIWYTAKHLTEVPQLKHVQFSVVNYRCSNSMNPCICVCARARVCKFGGPFIYTGTLKMKVVTIAPIVSSLRISMLKCGHTSGAVVKLLVPTTGDGTVMYVLPFLQLLELCKCGLPWVLQNVFK